MVTRITPLACPEAVNVKVKTLPDVPAVTVDGLSVMLPEAFAGAASETTDVNKAANNIRRGGSFQVKPESRFPKCGRLMSRASYSI
jgi:hypothetical protein